MEAAVADSRARIWFALFVLVVFCLGGAGGFVLGRHVPEFPQRPGPRNDPRGPEGRGMPRGLPVPPSFGRGPAGPAGLPPEVANRLATELNLDEAQRARFRTVLEDHRRKFEEVHREARDRFDSEQRELHAAIRALLRPDQVQRFDQFISGRRP
jgi:uncharacterized membrane protein